jgi:HAD superfamily hydrolase (TIGR01490 family)
MITSNQPAGKAATFFDVDGTLVQTTIAHYYAYFRLQRMSPPWRGLWHAAFMIKCAYYLALDRISRSKLNVVFYRSYRGLPADEIKARAKDCYRDVIRPRRFRQTAECIEEHRRAGREIVLVTGSIDFIIAPLAEELGIHNVLAPALLESDGRFTGELDGPPIGEQEKARRIRRFAEENGISLDQSHAYGDSIADLPMLEVVGHPHAVNPDKALSAIARARDWSTHYWMVDAAQEGNGR